MIDCTGSHERAQRAVGMLARLAFDHFSLHADDGGVSIRPRKRAMQYPHLIADARAMRDDIVTLMRDPRITGLFADDDESHDFRSWAGLFDFVNSCCVQEDDMVLTKRQLTSALYPFLHALGLPFTPVASVVRAMGHFAKRHVVSPLMDGSGRTDMWSGIRLLGYHEHCGEPMVTMHYRSANPMSGCGPEDADLTIDGAPFRLSALPELMEMQPMAGLSGVVFTDLTATRIRLTQAHVFVPTGEVGWRGDPYTTFHRPVYRRSRDGATAQLTLF